MAILRNREVTINAYVNDENLKVRVQDPWGNQEIVRFKELQFTKEEKDRIVKEMGDGIPLVNDKDLKIIRDQKQAEVEALREQNKPTVRETDGSVQTLEEPKDKDLKPKQTDAKLTDARKQVR